MTNIESCTIVCAGLDLDHESTTGGGGGWEVDDVVGAKIDFRQSIIHHRQTQQTVQNCVGTIGTLGTIQCSILQRWVFVASKR